MASLTFLGAARTVTGSKYLLQVDQERVFIVLATPCCLSAFSPEGTRGRALLEGAQAVKIHGAMVPVRAQIARVDSMSAHADSNQIVKWLQTFKTPPRQTYLVHGEAPAQDALKARIGSTLHWQVHIPQHGEKVEVAL